MSAAAAARGPGLFVSPLLISVMQFGDEPKSGERPLREVIDDAARVAAALAQAASRGANAGLLAAYAAQAAPYDDSAHGQRQLRRDTAAHLMDRTVAPSSVPGAGVLPLSDILDTLDPLPQRIFCIFEFRGGDGPVGRIERSPAYLERRKKERVALSNQYVRWRGALLAFEDAVQGRRQPGEAR